MTPVAPAYNADRLVVLNMALGRDSITELCLLLEGYLEVDGQWLTPADIDALVFSDLGYEWPQTYALIPRITQLCEEYGLRFLILRKPPADSEGTWSPERPWLETDWTSIEDKAAGGGYHLRPPILADYMSRQTVVSIGKGDCTENHKILPIRRLMNDLCLERFELDCRRWGHLVRKGERRPHVNLIGFAADEASRAEDGKSRSPDYVTEAYPLLQMGLTKADEQAVLDAWGLGHVLKSGCWMCPYQSAAHYWVIRETMSEQWAELLEYERIALVRNPKMFVTGRMPIAQAVERWRIKHPEATVEAVLNRGYNRGCTKKSEPRKRVEIEEPVPDDFADADAWPSDWPVDVAAHQWGLLSYEPGDLQQDETEVIAHRIDKASEPKGALPAKCILQWRGRSWVCTGSMSHGTYYEAGLYPLVPRKLWDGPIRAHGMADPKPEGVFSTQHGVRVYARNARGAEEYVLDAVGRISVSWGLKPPAEVSQLAPGSAGLQRLEGAGVQFMTAGQWEVFKTGGRAALEALDAQEDD